MASPSAPVLDECAICVDPLGTQGLAVLPCSHLFHEECIQLCLVKSCQKCPVCKRDTTPAQVRPLFLEASNKKLQPARNDQSNKFLRAARAGNSSQVLEFLRAGIDINNTYNLDGQNALHLASQKGHTEVVRELLSRGAEVELRTRKGNTALHMASLAGHHIIVTMLIAYGANVNAQSLNGGFSPLYMAAQENHEVVVRLLLALGANKTLATKAQGGHIPLDVALQQGHRRIVILLSEKKDCPSCACTWCTESCFVPGGRGDKETMTITTTGTTTVETETEPQNSGVIGYFHLTNNWWLMPLVIGGGIFMPAILRKYYC